MPKKPGYIQMNSPEDQKYYDALKAANFCDINDALDMRNFAIVRNGKSYSRFRGIQDLIRRYKRTDNL